MQVHKFTVTGHNKSMLKSSKAAKHDNLATLRKHKTDKRTRVDVRVLLSAGTTMLLVKEAL
jgi:hypothetical protein